MTNLHIRTIKCGHGDCIHLHGRNVLCTQQDCTSSLPVFLTDASTVSLSHGIKVFRSISSQEIPSYKMLDFGDHELSQETKGIW